MRKCSDSRCCRRPCAVALRRRPRSPQTDSPRRPCQPRLYCPTGCSRWRSVTRSSRLPTAQAVGEVRRSARAPAGGAARDRLLHLPVRGRRHPDAGTPRWTPTATRARSPCTCTGRTASPTSVATSRPTAVSRIAARSSDMFGADGNPMPIVVPSFSDLVLLGDNSRLRTRPRQPHRAVRVRARAARPEGYRR